MKKIIYAVVCLVLATSMYSCAGSYYVSAPPPPVTIVRPVQPGPGYAWVDGEYYWSGGRYAYRNGYWAHPHGNRSWNSGAWVQGSRGYYWRHGGWR